MTHAQIVQLLDKAATGLLALSQVTPQRPSPPTLQPARHLALALTHIEDAVSRITAAEGLERAWEAGEMR